MVVVPPFEYNSIKSKHNKIMITLNNQERITIEKDDPFLHNDSENTFEILKDSIIVLNVDTIKEIKEERFSLTKTIISSLGLSVFVLVLLMFALSGGGAFKT
jgi:hypothetical protein